MTKNRKPIAQLLLAAAPSATADGITRTILPLMAASAPGGTFLVGAVQTFARLPWLMWSLPAGKLADSKGFQRSLQIGIALKLAGLSFIFLSILSKQYFLLIPAAFVAVSGEVFFETGTQLAVMHRVPSTSRVQANTALQSTQLSLGQSIGPALTGVLFQLGSIVAVTLSAICHLTSWRAVRILTQGNSAESARRVDEVALKRKVTTKQGFTVLWRDKVLRATTVIGAFSMAAYGVWGSIFVLYVTGDSQLNASSVMYGLLSGCPAFGTFVGLFFFPKFIHRITGLGALMFMLFGQIGLFLPLIMGGNALTIAFGLCIYGFGLSGWASGVLGYRQKVVPMEHYASTNGAYRFVSWGASPLGALLGGWISVTMTIGVAACVGLALVIVQFFFVAPSKGIRAFNGK